MARQDRPIQWIFDELAPSGARRGGDPSEHAFRHDLSTFVREVVQNANDQALAFPRVTFRFVELEGESLSRFKHAIRWDTLEPHVRAAAESRGGQGLREALHEFHQERRLMLLTVEDRNTVGLTGAESESDSHFSALCKDTLYSHKDSESAGGSYGLGKSVLWSFSGLSTVLFNSVLFEDPADRQSPRLIGRTELPSHQVGKGAHARWYTGSGWYGNPTPVDDRGVRAESVWGREASSCADALHLTRDDDRSGTSILIVGFRDPTSEGEDSVGELIQRTSSSAAMYFWPAMLMGTRRLDVRVGDEEAQETVAVSDDQRVGPFVDCYQRRAEERQALEQPGDVVRRPIALELPNRRDGGRPGTGYVDLVVRLAPEGSGDDLVGHVAMFRGPGMVVRYWDRNALTVGMRPFHALLVCGEARNPREPDPADREVERFLRAAEPPGHDAWFSTPALKQTYKRGYNKALEQLRTAVNQELRELLAPRPAQGEKGPDRLQKRFPIGPRGGRASEESPFRFSELDARFDGERWHFEGRIRPTRARVAWHAILNLRELGDDGRPMDELSIAHLSLDPSSAHYQLRDGTALIDAGADVPEARFSGSSIALPDDALPGELSFEVTGALTEESAR